MYTTGAIQRVMRKLSGQSPEDIEKLEEILELVVFDRKQKLEKWPANMYKPEYVHLYIKALLKSGKTDKELFLELASFSILALEHL